MLEGNSQALQVESAPPNTQQDSSIQLDAELELRAGSSLQGVPITQGPATQRSPTHPAPDPIDSLHTRPSNFISPQHSLSSNPRVTLEPLLPRLDWQSLAPNVTPSQDHNALNAAHPHPAVPNTFSSSDWRTFNGTEAYFAMEANQPALNNDSLFSFNVEENTWETSLSALNAIIGDCSQFHQPITPIELTGPHSSLTRYSDGVPHGPTSEDAQNWSPQETQESSACPIIADENLAGWALGQCTEVSDCTTTASSPEDDLQRQRYQDSTTWSYAVERYRDTCFEPYERIENVDLTDETRDRMLIAIQQFLRAGLESQDAQKLSKLLDMSHGDAVDSSERFLLLPPKTSLQKYLDIFLTTFEPFTPMIPALSLNPNKLASRSSEREATLLLFLMIAFGAMLDPAPRARQFSYELTEVCRHSLKKTTDSGDITKQDRLILHCALISTCQTAFSGRKSHMEIGTAQRHMYLAVSDLSRNSV